MRKDERHNAVVGGAEAARPERPSSHEGTAQKNETSAREEVSQENEGDAESFASTPETRAQEGVERDSEQPIPSDNANVSQNASQPVIAPVSIPPSTSPYDPHHNERYDLYQRDQYSDYYLWDDFWLQDDFYRHDDYYPHLYYDNYYGNESPQPGYTAPSHHYAEAAAPLASYGLLDYVDRHHETPQRHERAWDHVGDYSETQHRDIGPDSTPHSEPYFAQGSGAGDQPGKNAEYQRPGYEHASNQQTAQQFARYEHVEPAASPFVYSSAVATSTVLAAEHIQYSGGDRANEPGLPARSAEVLPFPSDFVQRDETLARFDDGQIAQNTWLLDSRESTAAPLVSPELNRIVESSLASHHTEPATISRLQPYASEPSLLAQPQRDTELGLPSHSSDVLLPSLSQSELHALEMRASDPQLPVMSQCTWLTDSFSDERASEAQPLINAPAVPEVVAPLAAQHVQEPLHVAENQHSQGFAAPLIHPVEEVNSALVYDSPSYVNEPENMVSQCDSKPGSASHFQPEVVIERASEPSLLTHSPQAENLVALRAESWAWGSGDGACSHVPENLPFVGNSSSVSSSVVHSRATGAEVLERSETAQPISASAHDFVQRDGADARESFSETSSCVAPASLAASVVTASSLDDSEKRLTSNQFLVSEMPVSVVAPLAGSAIVNAANDTVTSFARGGDSQAIPATMVTSSALIQDSKAENEIVYPQVKHTFTQNVDNPAGVQNLLDIPNIAEQVVPASANLLPNSEAPLVHRDGASDRSERAAANHVIKSETVAASMLTEQASGGEVLLPAVVSQSVRSSGSASDVVHVTNASLDGTNDLINVTNEVKGFRVLDEDGNPLAFEFLPSHAVGATPAEAKDARTLVRDENANPLVMEEAVAAQVLSGKSVDGALDPRLPGFAQGDGAGARSAVDSNGQTARSSVPEKGEGGKDSSSVLHNAGVVAGAAALGGVRFAGKAAKEVLGFTGVAANQLLREDEDLSRIAQADDMIHDGIVAMRGVGGSGHTSLAERLIRSEIAAEDQLQPGPPFSQVSNDGSSPVVSADEKAARGKHAAAKQPTLHEKVDSAGAKDLLVSTRDEEISLLSDSLTGAERMSASLREASAPSDRDSIEGLLSLGSGEGRDSKPGMASRSKAARSEKRESVEGLLAEPVRESGRASVSEKGASAKAPAIVRGAGERDLEAVCGPKSSALAIEKGNNLKGLVTVKGKAASALEDDLEADGILDPKNPKDPKAKKKPATERERELAKKEAGRKAARKDGRGDSKAISVVSVGKNAGLKGALFVGGVAKSGAKKLVSDRNEELAVAMSSVDKTKKTVHTARKIAHAPIFLMQQARRAIHAAVTAVKSVINGAAALTAMGPVGGLIALMAFVLLIVIIAVLLGTASIINDEQEVSEVSALVAELDAQLTEEVNALGHQPILYLDASDTYNAKDGEGKTLTKDADLADDKSDLKEVVAESVTVRTDPAEIAAYIDAKYTGNWQVGAASWKYTIDAFGETWNLIEWEDMPEWAWKALNKVNRTDFKVTLRNELASLLTEDFGVEEAVAGAIASDTADEFATVIFDNQIQGMNDDVLMQIIRDSVKAHKSDLDLSDDEVRKLYYRMQKVISDLIGEEDPFAFVYDEIVLLHERLNWWSEEYGSFGLATSPGAGSILSLDGTGSGTMNAYGYPNSYGYDEAELANWDGFNEVSVYGISEAGTTSVTADGTRITNTWADATMGIACEGLQNDVFAYWTPGYKSATGTSGDVPVKITLYNPVTGKSITAEVIDCGGWRGFNERYAGKNLDRQWDLLPAVWKALGGAQEAGTMRVYWKVDPDATVGQAALQPKAFEDYPWPKETDEGGDEITLTRPTLIVHGVQDALCNDPLMEEIIDRDTFRTDAEFEAVKDFTVLKVKDVMKGLLTMENGEGEEFVDYNYLRRDLGCPFGEDADGSPREWKISHRYDPGYEDFELDDAYVEVKPLGDATAVYAVMAGEVKEVDDGEVTVRTYIDTANSAEVVYSTLKDVKVEEGDEVKEGQRLGTMKGSVLRVKWYEVNDAALQIETKKDWAYDVGLYMDGFAGYEKPEEPKEYVNMAGDWSGCSTVVEFARSRLGCPYVWGATGPDTFDCSGLTQWCYAQAGISIPRNSEAQRAGGQVIPMSELQPGDILWKPGHVGIYIGENLYIHAPHTGDVVKISGNAKGAFTCGLSYR